MMSIMTILLEDKIFSHARSTSAAKLKPISRHQKCFEELLPILQESLISKSRSKSQDSIIMWVLKLTSLDLPKLKNLENHCPAKRIHGLIPESYKNKESNTLDYKNLSQAIQALTKEYQRITFSAELSPNAGSNRTETLISLTMKEKETMTINSMQMCP